MSGSEAVTYPLTVTADVGVQIEVLDSDYRMLVRGASPLTISLDEGVYLVNGTVGGQQVQEIVRLLPIAEPLVVELRDPGGQGPASALKTAGSRKSSALAKMVRGADLVSHADHGAEVAVIIRGDTVKTKVDLSIGLRLLNRNGVAMRSDRENVEALQTQTHGGFAARGYDIPPGEYTLQYVTSSGETVHQAVPAFKGRRTVVFLSAGVGEVLTPKGEGFANITYSGVDPCRTVMITIPLGDSVLDHSESMRHAEILLHDLAAEGSSLSKAFLKTIDTGDQDPLLLIYVGAVILRRLEVGLSPTLDAPWPPERTSLETARARWLNTAHQRLRRAAAATGRLPDVTAGFWRLKAEGRPTRAPRALLGPPMLDCAWQWAIAHSLKDTAAVPDSPTLRSVIRGSGGGAPWLVWRPAAGKGEQVAGDSPAAGEDVDSLIHQIVALASEIGGGAGSDDALDFLSPEARTVALRVLRAAQTGNEQRSAGAELASAFAAPASALSQALERVVGELREKPQTATPADAAERRAPALELPVTVPDDPHKGRFGGQSRVNGFELSASFEPTRSRNWVTTQLVVVADAPVAEGAWAEFYLHDSFRRDHRVVLFSEGRAELSFTVWGGFTAGVWVPSHEVQLELDLSLLPNAPKIIRDR